MTFSINEHFLLVLTAVEIMVRQHLQESPLGCFKLTTRNQRTLLCDTYGANFCTARIISGTLEEMNYAVSPSNIILTSKTNSFLG